MTTLTTSRLTLAPFRMEDAGDLFAIRGDSEAMRYWDWPGDDDISETRIAARMMLDDVANGAAHYWTARAHHSFAGVFDLSEIAHNQADLGFMVPRGLWGQGYAREAASALIHHARKLNLKRLVARIHAANAASDALLRKLGFTQTEALLQLEIRPGLRVDCLRYALTL